MSQPKIRNRKKPALQLVAAGPEAAPEGTEFQYHEFTEAQLETIKPALDQIQAAQQLVGMFLGYVQKEAKLPDSTTGWQLQPSPATKKPCMRGTVKRA